MTNREKRRDTLIGVGLAVLILGTWAGLLVVNLVFVDWAVWWPLAPLAMALQCWLYVGIFIVAHDAMHGSLSPAMPHLNGLIGGLCVAVYAGFSYRALAAAHGDHHRYPGTARDPDFYDSDPTRFWPWYWAFFRRYFGLREFALLSAVSLLMGWLLQERAVLVLPFWALPAILSSAQLFYYGTFVPHRHTAVPFADKHRTRHSTLPWHWSLLTCFHFGHHQTHHLQPAVPWWRLPAAARKVMAA
ncbi:MAG: fatty acid desaturase [Pseudomonadota bacterium]